jgi:hypothetical protein
MTIGQMSIGQMATRLLMTTQKLMCTGIKDYCFQALWFKTNQYYRHITNEAVAK